MKIASKISRVELYKKGAIVHRTIDISESGSYEVWNIPISLNEASIRFSGDDVRVQKHSIRLDITNLPQEVSAEEQDTYQRAKDTLAQLNSIQEETEKQRAFWQNRSIPVQPKDRDGVPVPSNVDLMLAALQLQQDRISELKKEINTRCEAIRTQEEIVQRIKWKLDEYDIQKSKPKICKTLIMSVLGSGTLHIQYFFQSAAWYPSYTLQLSADYLRSHLIVSAEIWQESGEDWNEVELSLSTAEIDTMIELPTLNSRRIGRQERNRKPAWTPPPAGTDALFNDYDEHKKFHQRKKRPTTSPKPKKSRARTRRPPPAPLPKSQPSAMSAGSIPDISSPPSDTTDFFSMPKRKMMGKKTRTPPPAPPKPFVSEDLFDFQKIRLLSPDNPKRGILTAQSQQHLLAYELSTRYTWAMHIDTQSPTEPKAHNRLQTPRVHDFFDYVYQAKGKKNLPSGPRFRKIILMEEPVENTLVYISIPHRSQQVFRQIRLKNPLAAPLLSGPVDVYHNKKFLLQSTFDNIPAHGPFRFDLGVEANIRVSRTMTSKESIEGMFVKEKNIRNTVEFSIRNLLSLPIQVELMEVTPSVPENESSIQITELQSIPYCNLTLPETEPEGARGWSVNIPSQEIQEIEYSYTITIPTTKELVGGNRRGTL